MLSAQMNEESIYGALLSLGTLVGRERGESRLLQCIGHYIYLLFLAINKI